MCFYKRQADQEFVLSSDGNSNTSNGGGPSISFCSEVCCNVFNGKISKIIDMREIETFEYDLWQLFSNSL